MKVIFKKKSIKRINYYKLKKIYLLSGKINLLTSENEKLRIAYK